MPSLVVEAAGPGITLQDGGRHGYLRYGITAAGPMDPLMHATANRAAANPLDAAAIEISTGGVAVSVAGGELGLALIAPGFRVALDGVVFEAIRSQAGQLVGPASLHTASFSLQGEFAPEGFTLARSLTRRTLEIPVSAPANLPIEVEIELGRFQLPIADLATLRDGSVLALHVDARQPVILKVGDRAIARAELVELDGEIGARILNLL